MSFYWALEQLDEFDSAKSYPIPPIHSGPLTKFGFLDYS